MCRRYCCNPSTPRVTKLFGCFSASLFFCYLGRKKKVATAPARALVGKAWKARVLCKRNARSQVSLLKKKKSTLAKHKHCEHLYIILPVSNVAIRFLEPVLYNNCALCMCSCCQRRRLPRNYLSTVRYLEGGFAVQPYTAQ